MSSTDSSDETNLFKKIKEIFNEYMLNDIQSIAAFNYIKHIFVNKSNQTDRLREWILLKVNNHKYPKNISNFQIGCPDVCPLISVKPFHNPEDYPFIKELISNINIIKEEVINLKSIESNGFQPYKSPKGYSNLSSNDGIGSLANDSGSWNVFYLFLHELRFDSNCRLCPKTVELIEKLVPRQYKHAFFSAVTPNTHIISHNGPTNRKLRVHIPIINVEGSRIRVGDETKYFKEGEAIVFDDSFNHESWHDGDKTRINLIFDFWHDELTDGEVKFFKMLQQSRLKNGRKYIEIISKANDNTDVENYFEVIEKSKSILKDSDWWVG